MSQNNIPNSLPTIEKIIQRISAAEKSQQKEIRISIQEARDLTAELAIMSSRLGKTIQETYVILSKIQESTTKIDVKFDGGTF